MKSYNEPKTRPHHVREKGTRLSNTQRLAWGLIIGSLVLLICTVAAPLWLPDVIRAVIPERYIMAYAPQPVVEFVYGKRTFMELPTVVPNPTAAAGLLEEIHITETSLPTPLPTIGSGGGGEVQGTAAPNPTAELTLTPQSATSVPLPPEVLLSGAQIVGQGMNMCGEATLSTNLSYWGVPISNRTQFDIAGFINPNFENDPNTFLDNDSNTSPHELLAYARSLGFEGTQRVGGTVELLRELVAAGYPVLIERGFDELPEERWMGHYMLIMGYSDSASEFAALDSYWSLKRATDTSNPLMYWNYSRLDSLWAHFNWTYVVIYPYSHADRVRAIIGDDMDDATMYRKALQRVQDRLTENPNDHFGWFNLGTNFLGIGDHLRAAQAYDQWLSLNGLSGENFRMLWYQFAPYEAYYRNGEFDKIVTIASFTVDANNYPESEEGHYYLGLAYLAQGNTSAAQAQFELALDYNPNFEPARIELEKLTGG